MNRRQSAACATYAMPVQPVLRPLALFAVICGMLFPLLPATGQAVTYPDMPGVVTPNPEPALPSQFDTFTPPVNSLTPAATTPAFAEWTRTGGPDDTLVATGYQFTTNSGADAGKDTGFTVFGQTNAGNGAFAPAKDPTPGWR